MAEVAITIPYQWEPEPHQLPALQNPSRFKVFTWHRKAHKTTLAINKLILEAYMVKGTYWYVAPHYNQAKKIVWQEPEMLPKYCPPHIWAKRNNTENLITFPNGSVLYIMGADKPDSLRGPNPRGVVLDEYGDMKDEIWSGIVQPIMMANPSAWCWFMGTPKGRNDFFKKFIYAKESGDKSWWANILKASDSGIIGAQYLEEARKTTTEAFFKQEYECDFLDSASAYFRAIETNIEHNPWIVDEEGDYRVGVDLAKYQDWSVITPFNLNTFRCGPQIRFQQVDYALQKAMVETEYIRYNKAVTCIDSTGVGDPVCDDLKLKGINVEAFKFTEESRKNLLNNLAVLLELHKITIPNDPGLISELQGFQWTLTDTGKVKAVCVAPHDDRVMSLALAVWGIEEKIPRNHSNDYQTSVSDDPWAPPIVYSEINEDPYS